MSEKFGSVSADRIQGKEKKEKIGPGTCMELGKLKNPKEKVLSQHSQSLLSADYREY